MEKDNENLIAYEEKIHEIPLDKIEINTLNPRKKFVETEEDELIDSIITKGILNPIIVYKKKKDGKYVILDGERRYRACKRLNIKRIPGHILVREPSDLENLSMMFHIHNVREEWTDFAIALSLRKVLEEMGKDKEKINSKDIKELTKITSLSEYKVRKYLSFLQYPTEVIDKFLESEKQEKPEKGYDPDILAEMNRPIKQIEELFPSILNKYPVPKIIDACIKKKAKDIVKNNREFRLLSKALTATKQNKVRKELMEEKIIEFIKNVNVSPSKIFEDTSETVFQIEEILSKANYLYNQILNLNLNKLTLNEKDKLSTELDKLINVIRQKL